MGLKNFRDVDTHEIVTLDTDKDAARVTEVQGAKRSKYVYSATAGGQWLTYSVYEDITPAGGAGSRLTEQTATVAVGPNVFETQHVFDCGGPAVALLEGTVTAAAADGETFGLDAGDIAIDVRSVDISNDGVDPVSGTAIGAWCEDHPYDGSQALPHDGWQKFVITPRYVIVTVNIIDSTSFAPYAGADHPTASFDLTVTYAGGSS